MPRTIEGPKMYHDWYQHIINTEYGWFADIYVGGGRRAGGGAAWVSLLSVVQKIERLLSIILGIIDRKTQNRIDVRRLSCRRPQMSWRCFEFSLSIIRVTNDKKTQDGKNTMFLSFMVRIIEKLKTGSTSADFDVGGDRWAEGLVKFGFSIIRGTNKRKTRSRRDLRPKTFMSEATDELEGDQFDVFRLQSFDYFYHEQ